MRFLVRFAIDRKSPQVYGSIPETKRIKEEKGVEEDFMRNPLGENIGNKTALSGQGLPKHKVKQSIQIRSCDLLWDIR
ncbi:hypothetical protein SBDP1_420011 [Syntrophobacter sp. SbD1]|nr:hypothetical protein SBDP1_420011 [Syntrophobacter sp. SbD1]